MKIKLLDPECKPFRKYDSDAGYDLKCRKGFKLGPHSTLIVPSGIKIQLEKGTYADIKPRSSIFKQGVAISGVIDSDYIGEIGIMVHNMTEEVKLFGKYERLAQMIIKEFRNEPLEIVDELDQTERGTGGFGSTGK